MNSDYTDFELELSPSLLDNEYEIPEAPEAWSLDDFDDLVTSADAYDLL